MRIGKSEYYRYMLLTPTGLPKKNTAFAVPGGGLVGWSAEDGLVWTIAPPSDRHTLRAAEIYGIDPTDVTPEQRGVGKARNYVDDYGNNCRGRTRG